MKKICALPDCDNPIKGRRTRYCSGFCAQKLLFLRYLPGDKFEYCASDEHIMSKVRS